jgi:hypothetical protein
VTSVGEALWAAMYGRLTASPFPGISSLTRIQRKHRTRVTRENAPAIHLIEGMAKPTKTVACDWQWEMDGTVALFVRDDNGLQAADPLLIEAIKRINPETGTPYPGKAELLLLRIGPGRGGDEYTEIADEDATRVDIDLRFKFSTPRWTLGAV